MNVFGIGGTELLLIVLIMLIVAGPKRMMEWSYLLGRYLGQLRIMWRQMMESVQQEFDEAGVDIKLPKDLPTKRDIGRLANQALKPLQEPMQEVIDEYESQRKETEKALHEDAETMRSVVRLEETTNGHKKETTSPAAKEDQDSQGSFGTWSGKKQE